MKELAERSESEEIVAPKASCGITLLRRAILLLQISSWVQTGVWGEVGVGKRRSGKWEVCNASYAAGQELRVVRRRARESNGIRLRKLRRVEMRNWCAALVMSGLLALPLCAQQKSSGAGDDTTNAAPKAEKHATSSTAGGGRAVGSSKPVATKGVFALPATPRPTPFPGPAAADTRAPGQLVPRFEIAGLYEYINFAPGDPFA